MMGTMVQLQARNSGRETEEDTRGRRTGKEGAEGRDKEEGGEIK